MSGHSKWSTIKRKKGANDAKRGQIFSKLAREIMVAARSGGEVIENNNRLAMVVQRAKAVNMPNANIERAIARGAGGGDAANMEEITYAGYASGGIAMLIDVITDNRNRSVAQIRNTLESAGGRMADTASVAWLFENQGQILVEAAGLEFDDVFETAVDAGAEDVEAADGQISILTGPSDLDSVRRSLIESGLEVKQSELIRVATNPVAASERDSAAILKLVDALEELDDVRQVESNLELSDELVANFAAG